MLIVRASDDENSGDDARRRRREQYSPAAAAFPFHCRRAARSKGLGRGRGTGVPGNNRSLATVHQTFHRVDFATILHFDVIGTKEREGETTVLENVFLILIFAQNTIYKVCTEIYETMVENGITISILGR